MSRSSERLFLLFSALLLCVGLLFCRFQPFLRDRSVTVSHSDEESFTVVIDAGHGGVDCGAIGVSGLLEKDVNLAFAQMLAIILREAGVNVIMTREEDKLVLKEGEENAPSRKACDLKNRAEIANAVDNALLISIHMNAYPEEKYRGFEAYYSLNTPESRLYAEKIQSAVKEKYEPESRRCAKSSDSIYLLSHSQNPAILIECGFLSNRADSAKLSDKDYQKELCFLVFYAIMEVRENSLKG